METLLKNASVKDPVPCPNGCGRAYKGTERKHNLKKHLMYVCGVNPQFHCILCQKQLRHKRSLQLHMAHVHNQLYV